ncbi:hypothetical protein D3C78_897650 [compost metagenome]
MHAAFGELAAFHLRLGHPGEDVVVAAHVLYEMHGFAAARITIAGLAEPLLLRQARQHLLYVEPLVRVQALLLGQLAGVFEVRAADVVGGEGEPGAIRFLDAFRQVVADLHEVLAAAVDALPRVQAVGYAHRLGRAIGQHHQPAHAGLGGGVGLP